MTLVGSDESAFVKVHDPEYLRVAKRLCITATPRIYDDNSKAKAGQANAVLASMDDAAVFGPEVERDLLTDYKVIVLTVDEGAVSRTMQSSLAGLNGQLDLPDVARIVGCWNGLAKRAEEGAFGADETPMRRAVAFARDIKTSKRFTEAFEEVVEDYIEAARLGGDPIDESLPAETHHVDGGMNILIRNSEIDWLKTGEPGQCRVLSNVRCLSEGVDLPALDAVIFLNPRKSQVDIVQSVGRVMRKTPGKKYGYIILPVAIPAGASPEEALADNDRFRVVWEVLQALRAHDERFDVMINKIELNKNKPDKLIFVQTSFDNDEGGASCEGVAGPNEVALQLPLDSLEEWRNAIYARLVEKVGSRCYWETWAKDIAGIAGHHRTRLVELVKNLEVAPEFDALFEGHDFAAMNPVARIMRRMLDRLESARLDSETEELEKFYESVRLRCEGIDNAAGKQRVIKELYEKFFQLAFSKTAKSLGIVYTPIEVGDFIIRSVDALLRKHFGRRIWPESTRTSCTRTRSCCWRIASRRRSWSCRSK